MLQKSALSILKSGRNVFLTGSAGAGKTYLLNQYIQYLREHGAKVAVTASTGIAATHIGGMTIHAWSGLGILDQLSDKDLDNIASRKPVRERVCKVGVLIIDEISMLSANKLTSIDQILRHLKGKSSPFGGIQVVFSGDFFQLPPIDKNHLPANQKFAFMASIWTQADLALCYLTESHRHANDNLLKLLDEIRSGEVSHVGENLLAEKLNSTRDSLNENVIKLYTHNIDVDAANERKLQQLPGEVKQFDAESHGTKTLVDALKKSVLAPECLKLKTEAEVMFVKNNPDASYMNGTLGKVVGFDDEGLPLVKTVDGHDITASPAGWNILSESGDIRASYTQIPLRLAWAITVHKSQGMTLDRARMDLSKTFEPGQGYVALSRVKTWDGLQLSGCNHKSLQVDPLALKADSRFRALSSQAETDIASRSKKDFAKMYEKHILRCGGTIDPDKIKLNQERLASEPKYTSENPSTYAQTKVLIEAGKNLTAIAKYRDLTEGTIINHLEKLHKEFPYLDISKLKPDEEVLNAVRTAIINCREAATENTLDRQGNVRLSPIYAELDERYEYSEIKLARMFCE